MKFNDHICIIIFVVSFILIISVKGSDISPSLSQANEISDEVKEAFGPVFYEAEEEFGPISSLDLGKVKEAFGPIPSIDEAKEAFGPISSLDEAKETLGPISSAVLDEAKEALGPISPSTLDEAKDKFGPASSDVLDKAKEQLDSFASWISQNKEDVTSEDQKELGPTTSLDLDKVKETLGRKSSSDDSKEAKTKNKEDIVSSLLEEAQKEFGPISSLDIDKVKDSLPPLSPSILDEAKDVLGPSLFEAEDKEEISMDSFSISDEAQKEFGPVPSSNSNIDALSPISSEEEETGSTPISPSTLDEETSSISSKDLNEAEASLVSQTKEDISSDSPSILAKVQRELGPISSFYDDDASSPNFAPISPSNLDEAKQAIGSISSKAIDVAKENFDSISSFFSQNKAEISQEPEISLHSSSAYLDHDAALAIESLIKQAQSNSKLAMEEGNKLLNDATIESSDTGNCMKRCVHNYESCNQRLNKAMEDLGARNADLLIADVSAVEGEISACQNCFLDNIENHSPFKDLMEATIKATHECLNVLDHSD